MTQTMEKQFEPVDSMGYLGNHLILLQRNRWTVGDMLEAADDPALGQQRQTLRISRLTSLSGIPLFPDGKKNTPNQAEHLQDGWQDGIVTFCEWPAGGDVTATSLNCRNWRKVE